MVFTIITYYKPVRRHLSQPGVFTIINPITIHVRRHLYGVYHHNLLQSC